jgi:EAL domain-containing protein (putative c-di-GMP-specific phosphodiesterase class I)
VSAEYLRADLSVEAQVQRLPAEPLPYRERVGELSELLVEQGCLGLLLVDLSQLARVEQDYGSSTFRAVHAAATAMLLNLRGSAIRHEDLVAVDDPGGDAFLVFFNALRGRRPFRIADLRATAERVEKAVNAKLSGLASRYLSHPERIDVGFTLAVANPLVLPERLFSRMLDDAWQCVQVKRSQRRLEERCLLQEALLDGLLSIVFQPIVRLRDSRVLGYEALVRGPADTPLQGALALFELARKCDLAFELDRACRRLALRSARGLPPDAKLFLNVLPSALYDPEFRDADLVEHLGHLGLAPEQIVLEVTERCAIENYGLFSEALQEFTQMGFSIAVDDIGAGYSGLEKIAELNPRYLKFDMHLVRNIDASVVRREIGRALTVFARRMDSIIIAEGIETHEEREALMELGIEYGQGYLLGRPAKQFAAPGA